MRVDPGISRRAALTKHTVFMHVLEMCDRCAIVVQIFMGRSKQMS